MGGDPRGDGGGAAAMTMPAAKRMRRMQQLDAIREILEADEAARHHFFRRRACPRPNCFRPAGIFRSARRLALREDPIGCLQYDVTEGYGPLKAWLCVNG